MRGEYAAAAERFQSAYEHKPYPAFLFNAAVSFEKAKQLEKAKKFFTEYLEKDPNASDAAQVKLRLEIINQLLAPPPAPAAPAGPASSRDERPRWWSAAARRPPVRRGRAAAHDDGATTTRRHLSAPLPVLTDIETKGLVVIDSKPQGATIYLNDKRKGAFGKTPWQGSLESKPVRLILEQKGWKPEERAISPRSDKLIDVYIALSEEHYLGWVEIASNVPGRRRVHRSQGDRRHRPHPVHRPPEAGQAHHLSSSASASIHSSARSRCSRGRRRSTTSTCSRRRRAG